jgi:glutathione-regulated potassium-efflux system ancillary protein KefG
MFCQSVGMARVLILFAHPALQKSRVQRVLADFVKPLEGVTFHDLYEHYPELHIDVDAEQRLLAEHDVIVFQHPFYWYSSPAILKEWQDLVLEWGFAYGDEGVALRNKRMLTAISAGGAQDAYQRGGMNHFTIRELLAPFEQTARLCGMEYLPPFVLHAVHRLSKAEIESAAREYREWIVALRDDTLDFDAVRKRQRLNEAPIPLKKGALV